MLEVGNFSAFHQIKSDGYWRLYTGDPLWIYIIDHIHKKVKINLGNDINARQLFQYVVPANCWFASCPAPGCSFCFVGCTVAPGFDFADFELASRESLTGLYPDYKGIIKELCR